MSQTSLSSYLPRRLFGVVAALFFTLCVSLPETHAAFGLTTSTNYYTVDTDAGLVFKIRRVDSSSTTSPGDISSLIYNGVEYQDQSRGSQINSGFDWIYNDSSAVTVDATTIGTDFIKITVVAGDTAGSKVLTHYYIAHRGEPRIYMATYFTAEPEVQALVRYILRLQSAKLPDGPTPSDIRTTDKTVESGDIFGYSDTYADASLRGQTRSKHYSNMRLRDWSYIGATGNNVGAWMIRSNHEGDSGGPFYRSLLNQCGSDQEITYILNYGEVQTEAYRTGILNGPYILTFTDGSPPTTPDTSWFGDMDLIGFIGSSARGAVSGPSIIGRDADSQYTIGFSNSTAQYWTDPSSTDGSFTCSGMIPGTYTLKIYRDEYAVYQGSATITAGNTTTLGTIVINSDPNTVIPLWRIGTWDGTPKEFINGDKVTTMHPSDIRMAPWAPGTYVIGSSAPGTGYPAYQWKDINGSQVIQFDLTADQAALSATLRVGITVAYSGGRPNIQVNSWTSGFQGASSQPDTRSLTVGSYRGNNTIYTFSIPSSALVTGTNTITISPISGSGLSGFLSAGYSNDAVDFYLGVTRVRQIPGTMTTLNASAGDSGINLNWTTSSYATEYRIRRSETSGGPYTEIASGVTGTTFTDTSAIQGVTYYYVVNGTNTSGSGFDSPEASTLWLADSDGDLLPDYWETTYFPSPTTAGPLDDNDNDGYNNWSEWKAGTNPVDPNSKPGQTSGSVTLTAVADTSLFHRDGTYTYNSTNYGTAETLDAGQYGAGIWSMSYIRFDLSAIPQGATIDNAQFQISQTSASNIANFPVSRSDSWTTGRFGSYGLLDVADNTSQTWGETDLSGDTLGAEIVQGSNPQFDTSARTVDFNTDSESISGSTVSVTGTGLTGFIQNRLDASSNQGQATIIVDFTDDATSGARGLTFASRETTTGLQVPTLIVNYTHNVPVPDLDEDSDGLPDAWEASYFGNFNQTGQSDPDGDGLPNLLEYALGTSPISATSGNELPTIGTNVSGDHLTLTFNRINDSAITYTVEATNDLNETWTPIWSKNGSPNTGPVTVTDTAAIGDSNRRFLRLTVSR